jgi:translation initiation factor 3 subunit B
LLSHVKREKLYHFGWRPRPKNLLTPEEKKRVIKNLKQYERDFEVADRKRRQELNQELVASRRAVAESFAALLARNRAINAPLKAIRVRLRDGYDSDDESNYRIERKRVETIVSSKEQIVQ